MAANLFSSQQLSFKFLPVKGFCSAVAGRDLFHPLVEKTILSFSSFLLKKYFFSAEQQAEPPSSSHYSFEHKGLCTHTRTGTHINISQIS